MAADRNSAVMAVLRALGRPARIGFVAHKLGITEGEARDRVDALVAHGALERTTAGVRPAQRNSR